MSDRTTPTWADDSELHDEYAYGQQYSQADQQQYGHTDDSGRRAAQRESLRQYAQQAQTRPQMQPAHSPDQDQAGGYQPGYFTETGSWRFDVHGRTSEYTDQQAYDTFAPFDPYASYTAVEPEPAPTAAEPEPQKPGYTLPPVAESSWAVDTRRSKLLGRGVLLCILLVQAGLSLRLTGTAFQDEALYIASGHYELANLLHGTKLPVDFAAYFSGHPKLYPVLAGAVDSQFGLAGVRVVSLLFMLGATTLLYSLTRRLFNLRAALGAAALFSVLQSTMVLGNFATYDAAAIFLLGLSAWAVVRTDRMKAMAVLLAAPPAALAFGVKYASGLYLPTLVVLAVITAHRHRGVRALGRGVVLGTGIVVLLGIGYYFSGPLGGISSTTTDRAKGTDTAATMLQHSAEWGGLVFLAALGGTIAYVLRARMGEMPWIGGETSGRWRRAALGVLLTGTALLAPAYQIHLHTEISLYKHVGFGLFFAAPLAGLGMARLVGPHFRHPQLGILLYVVTLVFGMVQAQRAYSFPDSTQMTSYLRTVVDKKGSYLAEEQEVPAYYLRDKTNWTQWQNTYFMDYRGKDGKQYTGPDAFRQAVRDGKFDVIVMHGDVSPVTYEAVKEGLKNNSHYRLAAVFPYTTSSGEHAYRIWVKR
ncbi:MULTISPECIES: glycosyltransferase family 39 protein [Streptomyces]|uniref:glycosyltransferase family 39 protein n=1 Tax=Streptomyces TaxID=1883 RepID=UPI000B2D1D22|nr:MULTISPECIES: glycosyltransferase family 39 protein [Streptomyces]MDI5912841.1 glycosyltransferase family 39 protein [Streptomyces sp. 12257]